MASTHTVHLTARECERQHRPMSAELEGLDERAGRYRAGRYRAGRWQRWCTRLSVGLLCLFVFAQLRIELVFANTTAAFADLVAHAWGAEFLAQHIWDHGLLSGWSQAWSGGAPLYRFYPALPPVVAVCLGLVLPTAVAYLGKQAHISFPGPILVAAGAVVYLFNPANEVLGGNVLSTVVGEYSFAYALLAGVFFLSLFASDVERTRPRVSTGAGAGVAALCHPLGALFVALGMVVHVAWTESTRRRWAAVHLARTFVVMVGLSALWYLPFIVYRKFGDPPTFPRHTDWSSMLVPYPLPVEVILGVLVVVGVYEIVRRRLTLMLTVASLASLAALGVFLLPDGLLNNGRVQPMWNLCRLIVAGCGATFVVNTVAQRVPQRREDAVRLGVSAALVVAVLAGVSWATTTLPFGTRYVRDTAGWKVIDEYQWIVGPKVTVNQGLVRQYVAFGGLERGPAWPEYQALAATLNSVAEKRGCGRVGYEFELDGLLGSPYGSPYALQLLPKFTDNCISTINGLITHSPTAAFQYVGESAWSLRQERYVEGLPYDEPDESRGVEYLRELGCRYFLALTPETIEQVRATPGFTELATSGPWVIFAVDNATLVEPLASQPAVFPGSATVPWAKAAMAWFKQADPEAPRLVRSGPATWPRVNGLPQAAEPRPTTDVVVSNVVATDSSISFHVSRPGVPVLVRTSYFPTWKATGASGPFQSAPNWMVVVPTSTDVRLTNPASAVEVVSSIVSLATLAFVLAWGGWVLVRRRRLAHQA